MDIGIRQHVRRLLQWTGDGEAAAEKRVIQILSVVALGVGLALLPGCLAVAGAAAAAGTVVYVKGGSLGWIDGALRLENLAAPTPPVLGLPVLALTALPLSGTLAFAMELRRDINHHNNPEQNPKTTA